jgi:predicted SnoaL-like aldol condensation-catalyzing enzyme
MSEVVKRYFEMWNTGDVGIARKVLSPRWVDHAHPEVVGVAGVVEAVTAIRAGSPRVRFVVEAVLGNGDLVAAVGRVGPARLIWLVRIEGGLMAEMWTYTTDAPSRDDV